MVVVDREELAAMPRSSPPPVPTPAPPSVSCSGCGAALAWRKPDKLRVRVASRYLFVRLDDGIAEVTCERCGTDNDLPLQLVDAPETSD